MHDRDSFVRSFARSRSTVHCAAASLAARNTNPQTDVSLRSTRGLQNFENEQMLSRARQPVCIQSSRHLLRAIPKRLRRGVYIRRPSSRRTKICAGSSVVHQPAAAFAGSSASSTRGALPEPTKRIKEHFKMFYFNLYPLSPTHASTQTKRARKAREGALPCVPLIGSRTRSLARSLESQTSERWCWWRDGER